MNLFWLFALVALVMIGLVSALNALSFPRLGGNIELKEEPFVSIMVPARNEAQILDHTLDGLLELEYPNYEVLALDDHSDDDTYTILERRSQLNPILRTFKGSALPIHWSGKNWACQQLAEQSRGEILVFTDADVEWQPSSLKSLVALMDQLEVDCLTVWPNQQTIGRAERLVVPLMMFSIIGYLPELAVRKISWPVFSAANGQCLAFRRDAYEEIGGHRAVQSNVVEDVALAREVKRKHYRLAMALGNRQISGRMYHNWNEVLRGFGKNILAGHGGSPVLLLFSTIFHWLLFIVPWFWLVIQIVQSVTNSGEGNPAIPLAMIGLGVGARSLSAAVTGHRIEDALWMPVSVGLMTAVAGIAIWWHYSHGGPQWKGRWIIDNQN